MLFLAMVMVSFFLPRSKFSSIVGITHSPESLGTVAETSEGMGRGNYTLPPKLLKAFE
jgi:hypothetical protein